MKRFSLPTIQIIFVENIKVNNQLLYKGSKINYIVEGKGKTVVLLHGFLEEISIWESISQTLMEYYKVIMIDLPGFGKSEVISEIHSMELMAEVVNEIILTENSSECIIVGHSMGGYVSLAFADMFPEKIRGVVLFHSQAGADDENAKINRDRTIDIVLNNHSKFINNFIPTLFAEQNIAACRSEIDQLTRISLGTKDEGIIAALKGMRDRKDYLNLLKEGNFPVMFIIGKQDSKIPLGKINQQIILPKVSEALILENVGHMGFIEAKENTFASIVNFINKYYQS